VEEKSLQTPQFTADLHLAKREFLPSGERVEDYGPPDETVDR
jgi:hypothetical protein